MKIILKEFGRLIGDSLLETLKVAFAKRNDKELRDIMEKARQYVYEEAEKE